MNTALAGALQARADARAAIERINSALDTTSDAELDATERVADLESALEELGPRVALGEAQKEAQAELELKLDAALVQLRTVRATVKGLTKRAKEAESQLAAAQSAACVQLDNSLVPLQAQLRTRARASFEVGFKLLAEFHSISCGLMNLCEGTGVTVRYFPEDYPNLSLDNAFNELSAKAGLRRVGESGFLLVKYTGKSEGELIALLADK